MLGGPRGAPRAQARPGFPVQKAHSQQSVCIIMLPQVPHWRTYPSIPDDAYTIRGRVRTAARARQVPFLHFLPKTGFLRFCCTPRHCMAPCVERARSTKLTQIMETQAHSRCPGKLNEGGPLAASSPFLPCLMFCICTLCWSRSELPAQHHI